MFRIGDSYKPSFATITGKGDNPINGQCFSKGFHQQLRPQQDTNVERFHGRLDFRSTKLSVKLSHSFWPNGS